MSTCRIWSDILNVVNMYSLTLLPYSEKLWSKWFYYIKVESRKLLPLSLFIVNEHCSSHCASAVKFPRVETTGQTGLYMNNSTMEQLLIFQLAKFYFG